MFKSLLILCTLQYSAINGLDPDLVTSVIRTESNFDTMAVSKTGDHGLMQVRKKYVSQTVKMLREPCSNVALGTNILAKAINDCKSVSKGLVCYNRGKTGAINILASKDKYVRKVRAVYDKIKLQKDWKRIPYRTISLF